MAENNVQGINIQESSTQMASHPVTVRMNKLTEGIGILFSGVLTMLEALDPNTAQALVEDFVHTDEAVSVDSGKQEATKKEDAPTTSSAPAAPVDATTTPAATEKKGRGKANKKEPAAEAPATEAPAAEAPAAEAPQAEQAKPAAAPSVTVDDVARIVVQKVKANPGINDKIRALVNAYGAPRVTELKPEVLEAFLTDLAQL